MRKEVTSWPQSHPVPSSSHKSRGSWGKARRVVTAPQDLISAAWSLGLVETRIKWRVTRSARTAQCEEDSNKLSVPHLLCHHLTRRDMHSLSGLLGSFPGLCIPHARSIRHHPGVQVDGRQMFSCTEKQGCAHYPLDTKMKMAGGGKTGRPGRQPGLLSRHLMPVKAKRAGHFLPSLAESLQE